MNASPFDAVCRKAVAQFHSTPALLRKAQQRAVPTWLIDHAVHEADYARPGGQAGSAHEPAACFVWLVPSAEFEREDGTCAALVVVLKENGAAVSTHWAYARPTSRCWIPIHDQDEQRRIGNAVTALLAA